MASRQHEITVTFRGERCVFMNDGGATRVVIGDADEQRGEEPEGSSIIEEADEMQLVPGLNYRFWGHWTTHHKYGRQFVFTAFEEEKPATQAAVLTYLQQCRGCGIGFATARKIWDKFGADAVDRLADSPDEVAAAVKLKPENAHKAAEFLRERATTRRAKMDLLGLLHGRGLPKKTIDQALRDYGCEAAATFRQNPYLLMRYRGCGFLKTDKIYLELGKNPARMKRQALCVWHAIATSSNGDTWYPSAVARQALAEKISGANVDQDRALSLSLRFGALAERFDGGIRWLADAKKANDEERVAQYIAWAEDEARQDGMIWPDVDLLAIDEHQRSELRKALRGIIALLCGSPGTGKTYTAGELIKALVDSFGSALVAACAPTGKAAVRLTESLNRCGVALTANTIHTLLSVASADDGWQFMHDERNPLPHKVIIVDESSMLDCSLMRSLLAARGRGAHILFIGDPNQLPPVGHGSPLLDLINAGVACGTLTEIRRNSGRIVQACAEIRDVKRFTPSPRLDLEAGENLLHVERETPDGQIEMMVTLLQKFKDDPNRKYDPIWDVQVLVPVNKKSPLARKVINKKLQDLLNSDGKRAEGSPFRVGDKLINTKNGWLPSLQEDDPLANADGKIYVANGEQAEVLDVFPTRTIVKLQSPDRIIVIPRSSKADDDGDAPVDGEEEGTGTGCNWDLGYAISGHKSQGSEWKIVIVLLDEYSGAKRVQSRQYIYTVLSRGKVIVFTIGKKTVAEEACRRDGLRRKTFLVERIKALRPQNISHPACECGGVGCENCFGGNVPFAPLPFDWTDQAVAELLVGVC